MPCMNTINSTLWGGDFVSSNSQFIREGKYYPFDPLYEKEIMME